MSSKAVKTWRKKLKMKACSLFGGKCNICEYDKCLSALEFHHLDPHQKDFSLGSIRSNPKIWSDVVGELRKCIMLCANCHREVHEGIIEVENKVYINEDTDLNVNCLCGKKILGFNNYCSRECAGAFTLSSKKYITDDISITIEELRDVYKMSYLRIGEIIGFSDSTVKKNYKKMKKLKCQPITKCVRVSK